MIWGIKDVVFDERVLILEKEGYIYKIKFN